MKRKISRRKFLKQTAFAGAALPLAASKLAINAKTSVAANTSRQPLVLWYEKPAEQRVEALPNGNGRLGAMIFGGTTSERLQINEDTLNAGWPYEPNNREALKALPAAMELSFQGK